MKRSRAPQRAGLPSDGPPRKVPPERRRRALQKSGVSVGLGPNGVSDPAPDWEGRLSLLELENTNLSLEIDRLRKIRNELETSHNRYADFFEQGPLAFMTFDQMSRVFDEQEEQQRLLIELQNGRADLEKRVVARTRELQNANPRLEELSRRLVQTQENERRRIARELHDELGQRLTTLRLLLVNKTRHSSEPVANTFAEAAAEVAHALEQVRHMSRELRPHVLDDLALLAALKRHFKVFQEHAGIRVHFRCSRLEETLLDPHLKTAIFRIVQESLTNVARHAVRKMDFEQFLAGRSPLQHRESRPARKPGFAATAPLPFTRASGIQERVGLAHGTCAIQSRPGAGTSIQVQLPITLAPNQRL